MEDKAVYFERILKAGTKHPRLNSVLWLLLYREGCEYYDIDRTKAECILELIILIDKITQENDVNIMSEKFFNLDTKFKELLNEILSKKINEMDERFKIIVSSTDEDDIDERDDIERAREYFMFAKKAINKLEII
jgi:hypothetical protein